jgi:hypothetical protein
MMATSVVTTWVYLLAAAVALVAGDGAARLAAAVVLGYVVARVAVRRLGRLSTPAAPHAVGVGLVKAQA